MKMLNRYVSWWLVTLGFVVFLSIEATVIYFYLRFCGVI